MKTKKWIALLLTVALGLMLLSGCTPAMSSYMEESNKLEQWAGSDLEGDMSVTVRAEGQPDMQMDMHITGSAQAPGASDGVGHFTLTYEPVTVEGQTLQMPAMDFYFDNSNMNFYMNKSYFIDIYKQNNLPVPEALANIPTDYIQVDMNEMGNAGMAGLSTKGMQYLSSPAYKADAQELMETVLGDATPDFTFTQDGRSYTFEATGDQLVDTGVTVLKNIMSQWDTLLPQLKEMSSKAGMPISEQDLAILEQLRAAYDVAAVEKTADDLKAALQGTTINMTDAFTDTTNRTQMDMTLNLGAAGVMSMTMDATATLNDNVKVTLPTDATKMSMTEFMALTTNPTGEVQVLFNGTPLTFDQKPVIVNDRVLVPYRAVGEAMGKTVEWNETTRTITAYEGTGAEQDAVQLTIDSTEAMVNGQLVTLDSPATIVGDRTMVPLRFLSENFGYQVEWHDMVRMVTINGPAA